MDRSALLTMSAAERLPLNGPVNDSTFLSFNHAVDFNCIVTFVFFFFNIKMVIRPTESTTYHAIFLRF